MHVCQTQILGYDVTITQGNIFMYMLHMELHRKSTQAFMCEASEFSVIFWKDLIAVMKYIYR